MRSLLKGFAIGFIVGLLVTATAQSFIFPSFNFSNLLHETVAFFSFITFADVFTVWLGNALNLEEGIGFLVALFLIPTLIILYWLGVICLFKWLLENKNDPLRTKTRSIFANVTTGVLAGFVFGLLSTSYIAFSRYLHYGIDNFSDFLNYLNTYWLVLSLQLPTSWFLLDVLGVSESSIPPLEPLYYLIPLIVYGGLAIYLWKMYQKSI